jgi:hypothetical protein
MFFVVKVFFLPAYSIKHVERNTVQYLWIAPYALNPTPGKQKLKVKVKVKVKIQKPEQAEREHLIWF